MTRPSLNLTAKDCTAITLVGHDYAAVRSAFENTAKTFTGILTERIDLTVALKLTVRDNVTSVSIYAGHISAKTFTLKVCRNFAAIQVF